MTELLLATDNLGKAREYCLLLKGLPCTLVSSLKKGLRVTISESGSTFEENAALKARTYAQFSGMLTLADDSGLEVDALGGEPGPFSKRYAGEGASDEERLDFLLQKLSEVPWEQRSARFRCVIAVATPDGKLELCEGQCQGVIAYEPKGENGFGYDPIFYLPELGQTMAEVSLEEKNKISHRAEAARLVEPPRDLMVEADVLLVRDGSLRSHLSEQPIRSPRHRVVHALDHLLESVDFLDESVVGQWHFLHERCSPHEM